MIVIDTSTGSKEFLELIRKHHIPAELSPLHAGDFAFEGFGPEGSILIGIERKTIHDMLGCIQDGRYAQQRRKMADMYALSYLMLEGHFRPSPDGRLFQLYRGASWGPCMYSNRPVMYATLYRYLVSISLSNVMITYSRDMTETAYLVVELYHYFQKKWADHTSMLQKQTLNIPSITGKISLTRRWASELPGIGVKLGAAAEQHFKTPIRLATAEEVDWLNLPGVGTRLGVGTAQQIVREINGWRRDKL